MEKCTEWYKGYYVCAICPHCDIQDSYNCSICPIGETFVCIHCDKRFIIY